MLTVIKEILIIIAALYLFVVIRSHYSKGERIKDAIINNLTYVGAVLFSPITWWIGFIALIYIVYQMIH